VLGRLGVISLGLLAAAAPAAAGMSRRYGRRPGARFALGALAVLLGQHLLVGLAARKKHARLTVFDAITLSRGLAAAVLMGVVSSGVRHRGGFAGRVGWASLLYGSIVCDWLDGPITRRFQATTGLGALLDLESDSWLTLAAASAAVTWGGLPAYCLVAPSARYALLLAALRRTPYSTIYVDEPPWARQSGIAQMMLFTAATAPFGGRLTRWAVRLGAPVVAPLQVLVMALLYRRLLARIRS
jgi:phosphatidylglycerophosphate synthase